MTENEATENETPTSERIRWVRYAADCAERVLHLAGPQRPDAEAAIQAARAWADDPTGERRETCRETADRAYLGATLTASLSLIFGNRAVKAIQSTAAFSAALAAKAAVCGDATTFAAHAVDAAIDAAHDAGSAPGAEQAWQAERRKFYGLGP